MHVDDATELDSRERVSRARQLIWRKIRNASQVRFVSSLSRLATGSASNHASNQLWLVGSQSIRPLRLMVNCRLACCTPFAFQLLRRAFLLAFEGAPCRSR